MPNKPNAAKRRQIEYRADACRSIKGVAILRAFLIDQSQVNVDNLVNLCLIEGFRSIDPYWRGEGISIPALLKLYRFRRQAEICHIHKVASFILFGEGKKSYLRFMNEYVFPVTKGAGRSIKGVGPESKGESNGNNPLQRRN
jgi:hypothetical protein